jgi:hypothetical protein
MNRNHLRRIVALEAKFPPPLPDLSRLTIYELHDLKMLLVKRIIAQHKASGSQSPLPAWLAEFLGGETPKQRAAARIAAGLNPMLLAPFFKKPRLAPHRKQSDAVDRKRARPPNEPSDQLPWTAKTIANRRRPIRGKRRARRASRG